jgi:hypothetical protein
MDGRLQDHASELIFDRAALMADVVALLLVPPRLEMALSVSCARGATSRSGARCAGLA